MEHGSDGDTNYKWNTRNNPQMLGKRTRRLRNQRASRSYPDYSIIKIDKNTEKSPGDVRRIAVTQTPVKDHHRYQMGSIFKEQLY